MRNILAVAGKELRAYFHSAIGYAVLALFAVLCGFFFYNYTAAFVVQTFRMMATGQMAPNVSINEYIIRPMFEGVLSVVFVMLVIPMVTMRLFAEEKRTGTMELLLTSPLTDLQIILGKFFGALGLYVCLMLLAFLYIGLLFLYGNPSPKPLLAQALGFCLFGAALLALGMWISALTKNQIIAFGAAAVLFLLLYVFDWVSSFNSSTWARVMSYMALPTHLDNFAKGVIDSSDTVYYLSVTFAGIFLTARSVEALKGRP